MGLFCRDIKLLSKRDGAFLWTDRALLQKHMPFLQESGVLLWRDRAVLGDRAVLRRYKALLWRGRAFLQRDWALLRENRTLLLRDRALLLRDEADWKRQ